MAEADLNRSAADESSGRSVGFLRRRWRLLAALMLAWVVLTGLLIWLSRGPQNEPFVYQVF